MLEAERRTQADRIFAISFHRGKLSPLRPWKWCGAATHPCDIHSHSPCTVQRTAAEIEDIQQSVSHSVSLSVGKSSKQKFNLKSYYIFCIIQRHQQKGSAGMRGISLCKEICTAHTQCLGEENKRRSISFSGVEMRDEKKKPFSRTD